MDWLFDTSSYMPRTHCGSWSIWLAVLNVVSNIMIGVSYYAIPFTLMYLYKKRNRHFSKGWMVILFIVFIFLCGTTHFLDAAMFTWPAYNLLTLVDFATSIVSIITALLLPSVVVYMLRMRSPEELEQIIKEKEKLIHEHTHMQKEVQKLNHDLANQVQKLQNIIATQGWISQKEMDLDEMKRVIVELRAQYRPAG